MRVLLTGASGYIGSALASRLLAGGHAVTGLARSEAAAARLASADVVPLRGELRAPESWVAAVAEHAAIVHAAFEYHADGSEATEVDEQATAALVTAARGGGRCRRLIYTSNAFLLSDLGVIDETVDFSRAARGRWRLDLEGRVLAAGDDDLATSVLRVGAVYGGDGGSFPDFFRHARAHGSIAWIGDGTNRWSLIQRARAAGTSAG
jgi:nucleoside-diphosphate-sugar epimerase